MPAYSDSLPPTAIWPVDFAQVWNAQQPTLSRKSRLDLVNAAKLLMSMTFAAKARLFGSTIILLGCLCAHALPARAQGTPPGAYSSSSGGGGGGTNFGASTVIVTGGSGGLSGTAGFPTANTRYFVTANDTETAALAIGVANVTIECLPGITIQQTTASTDLFDFNSGSDGSRLINCTLNPPASGASAQLVNIVNGNRITIDGVVVNSITSTATNGGNGWIRIQQGSHNTIHNFRILNSADTGIYLSTSAVTISDTKIESGFIQITAVGKFGLQNNADNYFHMFNNYVKDVHIESVGGCFNNQNPTQSWNMDHVGCVWESGASSNDAGFRTFGCHACLWTNIYGEANGATSHSGVMLTFHDAQASTIDGFNLHMNDSAAAEPIQMLDTWDTVIANGTISGDQSANAPESAALNGWSPSQPAIAVASSAASGAGGHLQFKNIVIHTVASYTGTLISISCSAATNGGNCNNDEVSGVHAFMTGGTFLSLAIANSGTANNLSAHNNEINGAATGFSIPASITGTQLFDNTFVGVTTRYSLSSATLVRDQTGITFANIPSNLANGSVLFISDSTIANPCASGGTGAILKQLNGVHVCN
jgi:hypothetical protein